MDKQKRQSIIYALMAAIFYAVNVPVSKILLQKAGPTTMAALLYLGAGIGIGVLSFCNKKDQRMSERLSRKDLPYVIGMIVLDIAAPIFLMLGINHGTSANASLLGNFEIVATALIALMVFKEKISARLWLGILFVTVACALLSVEDITQWQFSFGSLFILMACVCWGFENNCTRKISAKDPLQIVLLKGIFSGAGSVVIGLCVGEQITAVWSVFAVLAVGVVAYGLSIFFYVYAQRTLGAARTSAYYAIAPFIGTLLSLLIFQTVPPTNYFIALGIMAVGAWLCASDEPIFKRKKE
jgi:drug/metabolite transporter (DMT)-like permease